MAKSNHADNEWDLRITETRVNCSAFEVRSIVVAAGVTVSINLNNHPKHKTIFLEPHAAANFRKQLSDGSWITAKFIAGDSYTEVPLAALGFKPIDDY